MNIPILRLGREYSSYDLVELAVGGERLTTHTKNSGIASEKADCIDRYFVIH
jgi:hypothetical protein